MKHTFSEWFSATRYWSFTVSSMPVLATVAYLVWSGSPVNWLCAILALVGNVTFHAAGNVLSDYWDFRKGVDNERAYAVPNLVFHKFEAVEYLRFATILFSIGAVIGLLLCLLSSWKLLVIGLIGFALAASYSFFKFRAMGDIFVFVCFGVLPLIGTSLVSAGSVDRDILVLSVPLGILTIAVLHNNNTVDIQTDRDSGIHTISMLLGERMSVSLYIAYLILPYLFVCAVCITSLLPKWALLCLLSLPVAVKNISAAMKYFKTGREALLGLDQKTAMLHLVFSATLIAGIVVATFV